MWVRSSVHTPGPAKLPPPLRPVWSSREGRGRKGGGPKQAGSKEPAGPATLKMAARQRQSPSEAVPAHAQRGVPARDTRWRQRRWGGRGGGGKTGGRAERVTASPRVRCGQLLMQGIPWAPVHSTADQPILLRCAFLQAPLPLPLWDLVTWGSIWPEKKTLSC